MNKRRFVLPLLTILMLIFIWGNSFMDGVSSTGNSDFILDFLNSLGIGGIFETIPIRKVAHFSEYLILSVLFVADIFAYESFDRFYWLPLSFSLVVACIDETIQLFSLGRESSLIDVWIDFSGAVAGFIISLLIIKITKKGAGR